MDGNCGARRYGVFSGVFLIALGAFFLALNFGKLHWDWRFWPLWMIVWGVVMLVLRLGGGREHSH